MGLESSVRDERFMLRLSHRRTLTKGMRRHGWEQRYVLDLTTMITTLLREDLTNFTTTSRPLTWSMAMVSFGYDIVAFLELYACDYTWLG